MTSYPFKSSRIDQYLGLNFQKEKEDFKIQQRRAYWALAPWIVMLLIAMLMFN